MSENIHIGHIQAGAATVGGTDHTIESGTLNIYSSPGDELSKLRALLDDLLVKISENPVLPTAVRDSAEQAKTVAAEPQPDTGRLRTLMNAVCKGAERVAAVTTTALNIISLINIIEGVR
jgi:hypothetical protein